MIGIVGAGVSGLALGYFLKRAGIPHIIVESRERVGGVVSSETLDSGVVDLGPQRMRLTPALMDVVREIGLEDRLEFAPRGLPIWIYRRGALRPIPRTLPDACFGDLLTLRGRARMLLEPFTRGADPEESVERYFVRKLGREAYEILLGPLFGGLYASDPAAMRVGLSLLPTLGQLGVRRSLLATFLRRVRSGVAPPPAVNFRGGMRTFVEALGSYDHESIELGTPVQAIERVGDGFRIVTAERSHEVERVVVTVEASVAAALLAPIAPDTASLLRTFRYNRLAMVHLSSDFQGRGFGYQVAFGEPLKTRGVTWNGSLFDRPGRFTAFLGGMKDPKIVAKRDDELGQIAVQEFDRVTGSGAHADHVSRSWIPAWDHSWTALQELRLPPGLALAGNYISRPGLLGRFAEARTLADRWSGVPAGSTP